MQSGSAESAPDATSQAENGLEGVWVEQSSPTGEQGEALRGEPTPRKREAAQPAEQAAPNVGRRYHETNPAHVVVGGPLPLALRRSRGRSEVR